MIESGLQANRVAGQRMMPRGNTLYSGSYHGHLNDLRSDGRFARVTNCNRYLLLKQLGRRCEARGFIGLVKLLMFALQVFPRRACRPNDRELESLMNPQRRNLDRASSRLDVFLGEPRRHNRHHYRVRNGWKLQRR